MDIKLKGLQVDVHDVRILENDVFVDFEYERLDKFSVKFFLYATIGKNSQEKRFCLKTVHTVYLQNEIYDEENELIQKIIHILIEPVIEIILMIDQMIQTPEERLH